MKAEYVLEKVTIDVQNHKVIIEDNGKDIPWQIKNFTDEDEWFSIEDRNGETVLDGNVWWDEQWGFQYVGFMEVTNKKTGETYFTNDGDYRNPENLEFTNGDSTPYPDLEWVEVRLYSPKNKETDKYQFRAVMKDGDGLMSIPLEYVNKDEVHELEAIGLYENQPDGTQQHVIDITLEQINSWKGLFMGFRHKVKQ